MDRPYIICHMTMSLDGKVTGGFLSLPECEKAIDVYYDINRQLKCNGYVCGRITMEGSFTDGYYPDLSEYEPVRHEGGVKKDFTGVELSGFYAVAFDPKGRLGWKSAYIEDWDSGYDKAQIIEVLSEKADERYLGYLEAMGIPYIFAGKCDIDVETALSKLKSLLGIERLLLEGGSIINGAFKSAGVIDELSLVVAPITGDRDDKPLFWEGEAEVYTLSASKILDGGVIWLNYKKNKADQH